MGRTSSDFLSIASRLLAVESAEAGQANLGGLLEAAESAIRKLDLRLVKLLGAEGFEALLRRAVHLAALEHPFLESVAVELPASPSDGPRQASTVHLNGLPEGAQGHDQAEVRAGLDALLGSFVWLLTTFIGEDLTLRQLWRVWPGASLDSAGESGGSGPEEAKP